MVGAMLAPWMGEADDADCVGAWCGSSSTTPWGSSGVPRNCAPPVSEHPQ